MDPFTIVATTVSTIKIVYQVSGVLYSFINDVSQIDTALQALADELESLKNAMVAIDKCLRSPSLLLEQTMEDENISELFLSTNLALESCQKTLIQFEELLIKVRGNHPEPNAFRKSVIKAKMNFNKVDINNYRIRISTHSSALQMALQTLTL
jgi:hypothetical protein